MNAGTFDTIPFTQKSHTTLRGHKQLLEMQCSQDHCSHQAGHQALTDAAHHTWCMHSRLHQLLERVGTAACMVAMVQDKTSYLCMAHALVRKEALLTGTTCVYSHL